IWKARDRQTGALVSVRVEEGEHDLDALRAAAGASARIASPHVVRVLGVGNREGTPFLVSEYVEGQSLRSYLRARGRLSWPEARGIADQLLEALQAGHEAGFVHGRLEPGLVQVTPSDGVKVGGFTAVAGLPDP